MSAYLVWLDAGGDLDPDPDDAEVFRASSSESAAASWAEDHCDCGGDVLLPLAVRVRGEAGGAWISYVVDVDYEPRYYAKCVE